MTANDLGFGMASDRFGLAQLPDGGSGANDHEQKIADRAAERAGFQTRDPIERVSRLRKAAQLNDHAFVRAPLAVINRYKRFCNATGLSYGEALDELMRRSGY
jgi:hypothetical protein